VVERLKAEHGAHVEWLPFLLRPDMPPEGRELPPAIRARAEQAGSRLKQMAQANGLPMVTSTWTPNPRLAHEVTEYAREHGLGEEFHRIVFRKFYGEGQDIGKWDVLRSAAQEVGLDPDDMQSTVQTGKYTPIVEEQLSEAYLLGVNSVPTYVLNDRYAIIGAQPYQVFEQAIARLQSDTDSDPDSDTDDADDTDDAP
jgi:predicted DsbA family dithiol-disulfide isomerase